MTRAKTLLSTLLLITASPSPAGAVNRPGTLAWDDYANVRFNYATCYPKSMKPQPEAENGDGRVFLGADGATLAVYGSNVEGGDRLDADLQPVLDEIAGVGARTTYRLRKANWLVTSGVGLKGEFYMKRFKRKDQVLTVELVYPARSHDVYASVATTLSRCFRIGSEPGF